MSTATKSYRDRVRPPVEELAEVVVDTLGIGARRYPMVVERLLPQFADLEGLDIPRDAVLVGLFTPSGQRDLSVLVAGLKYPMPRELRDTRKLVGKQSVLPMLEELTEAFADADDDMRAVLAHTALVLAIVGAEGCADAIASVRGDPESLPLLVVCGGPFGTSGEGITAVMQVPRPSVAAPPSFKDLMTELEQGGADDEQ